MEWSLLFILLVFVVLVLLKDRFKIPTTPTDYPYENLETLFSPAERSFLGVLQKVTDGKFVVFGKVRVADVVKPSKGLSKSKRQKAFNRISSKHFDYVLCHKDDMSIHSVIELDDKSHNKKSRVDRDIFLSKTCEAAGVTLHRFKNSSTYNIQEIKNTLFPTQPAEAEVSSNHINQNKEQQTELKAHFCPKCSAELVEKIAKKGKHKGDRFLACSSFPKCKYMLEIKKENQHN